ncbi:MAG: PEP/pyruvate-binding domain-containing protein [Desulfatiglandales bacterium]
MNLSLRLDEITERDHPRVGGKFLALSRMAKEGLHVPNAICIVAEVYERHISLSGLRERILLELTRKSFEEMRWEEMWDASLRIRNMFLTTPLLPDIYSGLREAIEREFHDKSAVVRSSAPGEDSSNASFAGIHESYVNVTGTENILEHVQKVWASLWSDAALLYRQELGLAVETSAMAVIVQEIIDGDRSGVVFSMSPNDPAQAIIESVHGLNQGLVDGSVEPDRWVLSRTSGRVLDHLAPPREKQVVTAPGGVRVKELSAEQARRSPLIEAEVTLVFGLAVAAEKLFRAPQDVEWTFKGSTLYVLQSRPITTVENTARDDRRPWYLSLRGTFDNLKSLRLKIEEELIPAMVEEASRLSETEFGELSDADLAEEIEKRRQIHDHWVKVYWKDFIPFAHGARLFGQVYNDTIRPTDPYEFMDLLGNTEMMSLARNEILEEMAGMVRADPQLEKALREKQFAMAEKEFLRKLEGFMEKFYDLACGKAQCFQGPDGVVPIVLEMASRPPRDKLMKTKDGTALREAFLSRFQGEERARAHELLDLARTSYRLRDDDNIHLGRIEGRLIDAAEEGKRRLRARGLADPENLEVQAVARSLRDPTFVQEASSLVEIEKSGFVAKPRQLIGQPSGPGLAKGRARVIKEASDLLAFKAGEVLVCDALDPNMTFVVPLCAAIVERRGGMLIHGAIIAREYGLACVTGVADATLLIDTGDPLTVDGYLGIVVIG